MSKKAKGGVSAKIQSELDKLDAAAQRTEELSQSDVTGGYTRPQRPDNLETVSSGAGYWDFVKEPVFVGHVTGKFLAPKDIVKGEQITKKGTLIGYNAIELHLDDVTGKYEPTGRETILSNSYTIDKDLKADNFNPKTIWWIEFVEKKQIKGKPFNVFYTAKVKQ